MATIITQILRRTPTLYRSRVAISNYRRSCQIESNASSRVSFSTFYHQNTKQLDDHTGQASSTQTISQTKLPENLISDDNVPLTATLCNLLHHLQIEEAIDVIKSHKTEVDGDQLLCSLIMVLKKFDERSPFDAFVELVCRIRDRSEGKDLIGQILIETVAINGETIDALVFVKLLQQFRGIGTKISTATCDQLLLHVHNNLPIDIHGRATTLLKKMSDRTTEIELEPIDLSRDPESMTSSELEWHLNELQSKNMDCRAVLQRLLQLLVFMGKYDRALEIHQLCKDHKVVFSPKMLFIRLNLMIHTKNLSEAEKTFNQWRKKHCSIPIDESIVIDLASLMIENGHIEKAKEILAYRAIGKLTGGTHSHTNICALLSNVATLSANNGSLTNQSEDFLQFLTKLGYCYVHQVFKGPIIKEYLLKNDIRNAMAEVEKLTENPCKEIPMHFELSTTLIELANREDDDNDPISPAEAKYLLDKLVKTMQRTYGERNADVSLIIAVAKAGNDNQLRQFLKKAKFNADFLVKKCEYLDNVEATLFKVVECSRGMRHLSTVFTEEDLYNSLLSKYIKENNVTAVRALFERMTTDDKNIRLTEKFFQNVAYIFKKNNLELPAELQMHLRKS